MQRTAALTLLAWVAAAGAGTAQTFIELDSQPGEPIGNGQHWLITPANGAFFAEVNGSGGITVRVNDGGPFDDWSAAFAAPLDAPLSAGLYDDVQVFPFQAPLAPGLNVEREHARCNDVFGRFTVLEVSVGTGGVVTSLAADFEQRCAPQDPALFGSVRFNSSVPVAARLSVGAATVAEGEAGALSLDVPASLSKPLPFRVTAAYATSDASATAGSDYQAVSGTLTIPAGQTSAALVVLVVGDTVVEGDETFHVTLSGVVGAPLAFGQAVARILDDDSGQSLLFVDSDLGEYIGQGQLWRFTAADGVFSASRTFDNGVKIDFANFGGWAATFAAPNDAPLVVGTYATATRWPFQQPGVAGLDVNGEHRGCNELTGRFVVHEAAYGTGGAVERFAADFEQACEFQEKWIHGGVRYRSTIPLHVVSARPREAAEAGGPAAVDLLLAWPQATPATVSYQTRAGTATAGDDYLPASGTVTFAPGTALAPRAVSIVSDRRDEVTERFDVALSGASGAGLLRTRAGIDILDDDPRFPFAAAHGLDVTRALHHPSSLTYHRYVFDEQPNTSYEVVVDAVSGDLGDDVPIPGISVTKHGNGFSDSDPVGTGPSRSLRWMAEGTGSVEVRVASTSCTTECGDDDTYRLRVYDTTYAGARFNNTSGQRTILILQNPTSEFAEAIARFWRADGTLAGLGSWFLQPHASVAIDTSSLRGVADTAGSVTVTHTAPYGALAGKTVALDPSAGVTFDTPLVPRPR